MANDNNLEFRPRVPDDEGPYLVRPAHDEALEAQLKAEAPTPTTIVNPNPLGSEDYVGTDPIYQNHANDTAKPLAAEEGVEKDAEDHLRELHNLDDADEGDVVDDFGVGGMALVAKQGSGARVVRTVFPGQEGYDREKAEEQAGPPLFVYADEKDEEDGEEKQKSRQPDNLGTNMGASVQSPKAPEAPESASEGAGNKPARRTQVKPE